MPFSPLPAWSAPGTPSTLTAIGPPSTPMPWADTPTHASPDRVSSSWRLDHSGSASTPPLTLSHSTSTVPLNRERSSGVRTRTRVVNGAEPASVKAQRPSAPCRPSAAYDVAVPEAAYSRSV
jgi:hypothetical protein